VYAHAITRGLQRSAFGSSPPGCGLSPEPLETMSGNPGVMGCMLGISVPEIVLHRSQVGALVEVVAAGMPEHMGPDSSKIGLLAGHTHDVVDGLAGDLRLALRDK
jgi:hypothetical protein